MKKYKVYLTMEFTATVEADTEDEARDFLANAIEYGGKKEIKGLRQINNAVVKRYYGGGNEILEDGTVVVR